MWITETTTIEVSTFGDPEMRTIDGPDVRRWVDVPPAHNCRTCGAPDQHGPCSYCTPRAKR